MTAILRAGDLPGSPVVSLAGERLAEIKDVVYDRSSGDLLGFTLNDPGFFSGSRDDGLPIDAVHGIGDAAVVVAGPHVLVGVDSIVTANERRGNNVLADRVLTEEGAEIGEVVDVLLDPSHRPAEGRRLRGRVPGRSHRHRSDQGRRRGVRRASRRPWERQCASLKLATGRSWTRPRRRPSATSKGS